MDQQRRRRMQQRLALRAGDRWRRTDDARAPRVFHVGGRPVRAWSGADRWSGRRCAIRAPQGFAVVGSN